MSDVQTATRRGLSTLTGTYGRGKTMLPLRDFVYALESKRERRAQIAYRATVAAIGMAVVAMLMFLGACGLAAVPEVHRGYVVTTALVGALFLAAATFTWVYAINKAPKAAPKAGTAQPVTFDAAERLDLATLDGEHPDGDRMVVGAYLDGSPTYAAPPAGEPFTYRHPDGRPRPVRRISPYPCPDLGAAGVPAGHVDPATGVYYARPIDLTGLTGGRADVTAEVVGRIDAAVAAHEGSVVVSPEWGAPTR